MKCVLYLRPHCSLNLVAFYVVLLLFLVTPIPKAMAAIQTGRRQMRAPGLPGSTAVPNRLDTDEG